MILVDSGDGERMTAVYDFCEPYPGIMPCKGDQVLKKNLTEKGDEVTRATFLRYSKTKIGESQLLINVSTNYYKGQLYRNLKIERVQDVEQRAGFCEFPRNYPDHYFNMLTNEEKRVDGSFHAGGRPVESLDCRVYSACAGDFLIDTHVAKVREELVKKGMTRDRAKKEFNHKMLIDKWRKERGV
jgi:phage terminase large subunit GpA-like protein